MPVDLPTLAAGRRYGRRYQRDLARLQRRLERALAAHIVHSRRAIVVLEGWDTAGKDGIIQRTIQRWRAQGK